MKRLKTAARGVWQLFKIHVKTRCTLARAWCSIDAGNCPVLSSLSLAWPKVVSQSSVAIFILLFHLSNYNVNLITSSRWYGREAYKKLQFELTIVWAEHWESSHWPQSFTVCGWSVRYCSWPTASPEQSQVCAELDSTVGKLPQNFGLMVD